MGTAERNLTIFTLLFVLGFLGLGAFYYEYEWIVLRFPLLVGLVACVLCVGNLVKGLRDSKTVGDPGKVAESGTGPAPRTFRQVLPAMMWVVAVVPVVFLLGYAIGLPLYVFAYLKTHGHGWRLSCVLSLGTLAVVYLGFVKALGVLLPVLPIGFS